MIILKKYPNTSSLIPKTGSCTLFVNSDNLAMLKLENGDIVEVGKYPASSFTTTLNTETSSETISWDLPSPFLTYSLQFNLTSSPGVATSIKLNVKLSMDGSNWVGGEVDPYLYVTLSSTSGSAIGGLSLKASWKYVKVSVESKVAEGIIEILGGS